MLAHIRGRRPHLHLARPPVYANRYNARLITTDSRNRLSNFWAPTGGISSPQDSEQDDSHALLIRASFLRQAHSGVFHLLPLGQRVLQKLESLIDKHMQHPAHQVRASKLSLSTLSTAALWQRSGRYDSNNPATNAELLKVQDRRDSGFILSPTHEEEITALVGGGGGGGGDAGLGTGTGTGTGGGGGGLIQSYKDLPLRVYQVGRKYRDEKRPRKGLLRAKEFVMKDLYTFDWEREGALKTYEVVRRAYDALFRELGVPFLVAEASSGDMGGSLSHEYHFASEKGEDWVWSCRGGGGGGKDGGRGCGYVANEELVEKGPASPRGGGGGGGVVEEQQDGKSSQYLIFTGITSDRKTSITIHVPTPPSTSPQSPLPPPSWSTISHYLNLHALKRALTPYNLTIDTGIESSTLATLLPHTTSNITLWDSSLRPPSTTSSSSSSCPNNTTDTPTDTTTTTTTTTQPIIAAPLTPIHPNSPCPRCPTGTLHPTKAIEVAHTFHLGTRYSIPLHATVAVPHRKEKVALEMGCHGIGVSRLIGAIAAVMADGKGLNWPRLVAPWEVVIVEAGGKGAQGGEKGGGGVGVYDELVGRGRGWGREDGDGDGERDGEVGDWDIDVVLDDRPIKSLGWKLRDADLIGYPVVVVLGRGWRERREVEVQCRRLGVKKDVGLEGLRGEVLGLLAQL